MMQVCHAMHALTACKCLNNTSVPDNASVSRNEAEVRKEKRVHRSRSSLRDLSHASAFICVSQHPNPNPICRPGSQHSTQHNSMPNAHTTHQQGCCRLTTNQPINSPTSSSSALFVMPLRCATASSPPEAIRFILRVATLVPEDEVHCGIKVRTAEKVAASAAEGKQCRHH